MGHRIGSSGRRMIAAAGLLAGLAGWWSTGGVSVGQGPAERAVSRTTAMFGVAPGQVARTGIANVKGEDGIVVIGVRFFDAQGQLIAESRGRQPLKLGEAFFFDFGGDPSERTEVRAVFALLGRPTDFVASVQLVDLATGKTEHGERFLPEHGGHTYFGAAELPGPGAGR